MLTGLPRDRGWSFPAAGEGVRARLRPPLLHLPQRGIQAANWPTSPMPTLCFDGRWKYYPRATSSTSRNGLPSMQLFSRELTQSGQTLSC